MLPITLDIPLRQPEIQYEDLVRSLIESNAKVIGFDVAVDEVPIVDVLDSGDHLIDEHEDRLEGELAERLIEECLEGRPHEIHYQHVEIS